MIKIIACISKNNVIGNNGDLIFKDKQDMKHFRETTEGHYIVMGYKTWKSLGCKALPNRLNIVLTKETTDSKLKSVIDGGGVLFNNLGDVKHIAPFNKRDVFITGGGQIYEQTIGFADELIITEFHEDAEGDVFFPRYLGS